MEVSRGEGGRAEELGLRGGINNRIGIGGKSIEEANPLVVRRASLPRGNMNGRALGVVIAVPGDGAQ